MAITNYNELKTALSNWSGRSALTSVLPDFIMLGEERIKHGSSFNGTKTKRLRTREMVTVGTVGTTAAGINYIDLPSGFLEFEGDIYISGLNDKGQLKNITSAKFIEGGYHTYTGTPAVYRISGSKIYLGPIPSSAFTISGAYYALPALSDSTTTNSILTNYPNIYLYACLIELFSYVRSAEKALQYFTLYASAVESANSSNQEALFSNATMQVLGSTP